MVKCKALAGSTVKGLNQNVIERCCTTRSYQCADTSQYIDISQTCFLARDAFVRTNRRAIANDVRPSVRLGRSCVVIITVHVSADLSLRLDSPMFWEP